MINLKNTRAGAAIAALGLATACSAVAGSVPGNDGDVCSVEAQEISGGTLITGVVRADENASGSYRFTVKGRGASGSSNISQGGAFEAKAGEEVRLGRVVLSSPGATYDATLELELSGDTYSCDGRFGAI